MYDFQDIIPTAVEIAGNLLGQQEAQKASSDANTTAFNRNEYLMNLQYEKQKEFAKNSIQWRVADAVAAGLHPLAAIGAQGSSYSPTVIAGDVQPDMSMSNFYRETGQDISRAMTAMLNKKERQVAIQTALTTERMQLENDLLRSQISRANVYGPAFPNTSGLDDSLLPGQGNTPPVQPQALRPVVNQPGRPGQDVGSITDYAFARTHGGGLAVVPSKDVKERIEDTLVPEMMWSVRNLALPALTGVPAPSSKHYKLPAGYSEWKWSAGEQEFRPWNRKYGFSRPYYPEY